MTAKWLINRRLALASLLLASVLLPVSGCKRRNRLSPTERDAAEQCRRLAKKRLPLDIVARANSAGRKWENGAMDPEPILIDAMLTTPIGEVKPVMVLALSDEDEDVLGIIISERYSQSDAPGGDSREERYPLYTGGGPFAVSHEIVPVMIRSAGQCKDEVLWSEYLEANAFDPGKVPPIWVSIPSDNVHVQISVFDAAGHTSAPVDLREVK